MNANLKRRKFIKGLGSTALLGGMAGGFPLPAVGQSKPVKFTLSWLAVGSTAYGHIARENGYFSKRGIAVDVSRGFGSVAAAQTIAQGQFDFGIVGAGPLLLAIARGLPLQGIATVSYDSQGGVLVRDDSPIRKPQDLAGKRIGVVPTSAETPFFPAYLKKVGISLNAVTIQQLDNRVLERTLIDKQVDAVVSIASSSVATMRAQNAPHRFMLMSNEGIHFYGNVLVTRPELVKNNPDVCQKVVDGIMDALAFQLREPEKAIDAFINQVPEIGASPLGRENTRLSQGMFLTAVIADEAIKNGLGWSSLPKWSAMTDLVMEYGGLPVGTRAPALDAVVTNQFVGRVKLSSDEWAKARQLNSPFIKLLT